MDQEGFLVQGRGTDIGDSNFKDIWKKGGESNSLYERKTSYLSRRKRRV